MARVLAALAIAFLVPSLAVQSQVRTVRGEVRDTAGNPLEHVEVIESEIRRLDEVVQGFLKFSRPEDLRLQPVRVMAIFDEILPVIKPEAAANHVRVEVDAPITVPAVNGDASMLRQAFLNLAMNACQAMPNGGTLRLSAAPAP